MGQGRRLSAPSASSGGRRRAGSRDGSKAEMGGGIHGVARPHLFPVLVAPNPFVVADALAPGETSSWPLGPFSGKGACGVAQ